MLKSLTLPKGLYYITIAKVLFITSLKYQVFKIYISLENQTAASRSGNKPLHPQSYYLCTIQLVIVIIPVYSIGLKIFKDTFLLNIYIKQ